MFLATMATLNGIKHTLEKYVGRRILLKANKGRRQIETKEGVLETLYPSVFVVKLESGYDSSERVSFSYSDILTSNVKIKVFKENEAC